MSYSKDGHPTHLNVPNVMPTHQCTNYYVAIWWSIATCIHSCTQ